MRKIVLVNLLLVANLIAINSQQKLRFSIFVNPCINWLSSDVKTVKSDGATFGFDAGLTMDKFFAPNYAISTGISIGSLGGNLRYDSITPFSTHTGDVKVPAGSTVKYKLQYITVPLGLKFKTNEIGYFTYFAHLGFTLQANIKATGTSTDASQTLDNDNISENIGFFNLGYHIGGGVEYSLGGNTAIVIGITYTNGFVDITSNPSNPDDKITTSSFAIRLGVLF
jgi:opacity protein-like surface antigen